ncbi:succinate dehydrogenase, hydrophobic membrane anchor protein [Aliidongia dinghuensis]|uniref:Succinate dehydrogenase hydrophobic membrane anchor subunit n=1 Tax=Aliidongia dinghuensis TaxID=1867774 RepID=A0A8J2YZF0_9PROT|nr:succinate dehydrogenase, hydrophobic membrane anchor protein [Aliidongia dinghuensis]GGF45888.1 succinate dehydrogenase, hydrophobic membrane anchor protein [Aliidongia dinghuensis]
MAEKMRSPLGSARGLGSAREGAKEWWVMRLSSLALIPLSLWFAASVIANAGADYESFAAWVASPVPAVLLTITIAVTFWHMAHGLQVVIEDYVHVEWQKLAALVVVKFGCVLLGVVGVFAVLRIAFGG